MIDTPPIMYGSPEEILEWIAHLKELPDSEEVRDELKRAEGYLAGAIRLDEAGIPR
jgi:hypothetical protein